MRLQPLINLALDTLASADRTEQYLAAQILSKLPESITYLEPLLSSDDPELVSISLESMKGKADISIHALLDVMQNWQDSEIKLLCLKAIQIYPDALKAVDALITQLCSQEEFWDGEWNDADDLRLNAARCLVPIAPSLCNEHIQKILNALKHQDFEPDLVALLIKVIANNHHNNLNDADLSELPFSKRQLALASTDKHHLFDCIHNDDLLLSRNAYQRLNELNAREYVEEFVAALSHPDQRIRDISTRTLCDWNFKLETEHLKPLLSQPNTSINCLLPIVDREAALWLRELLLTKQLSSHHIASVVQLSVLRNLECNSLLPTLYELFPSLSELHQVEILTVIEREPSIVLSAAFLRQTIESCDYSQVVKQCLVKHLASQPEQSHQHYLQELLFFTQPLEIKELDAVNEPLNDKKAQATAPFSSLSALMVSPPTSVKANDNNAQWDNKISNRSFAMKFCKSRPLLESFAKSEEAKELSQYELKEFIYACIRLKLTPEIINEVIECQILDTIAQDTSWQYRSLWDWLGHDKTIRYLQRLQGIENLSLIESLIPYHDDIDILTRFSSHSYIGIKQKAHLRLYELGVTSEIEFFRSLLTDLEMQPLLSEFDLDRAIILLNEVSQQDLYLALSGLNAILNTRNSELTAA